MLHVLQVGKYYPPYRGGMETHLADLCQALRDQVRLEVLVANTSNETGEDLESGVAVTRLATPATILANPVCPDLVGRLRRSRADIVHLHWPNPLALLAYVLSGTKIPLVLTYHSDIVRQKWSGALFQPLLDFALRQATILATSPNYIQSSPTLRRFRDRCKVVPLGINPHWATSADPEKVHSFRRQYGSRMVLATGRLIYYKGFQYAIEAMQRVNGHLVIAGDGPMRKDLEQLAANCGVQDKVSFAGAVSDSDLRALYQAAAVFALPSIARSEAFGIVQLEAMAAGTPVVNTRLDSGVPFVSLHEETGLTVNPQDAEALAQALDTLLSDDGLRARMGAAAQQRVHTQFTVEKMAADTLRIYRDVTGWHGAAAPDANSAAAGKALAE